MTPVPSSIYAERFMATVAIVFANFNKISYKVTQLQTRASKNNTLTAGRGEVKMICKNHQLNTAYIETVNELMTYPTRNC